MDNRVIRYTNVRYLVDLIGGVSNFADKINKSQSQASQFAGTNPIKGIGNKIAREIESAFVKEYGWLDVAHPELWKDADILQQQSLSQGGQSQSQSQGLSPRSRSLDKLITALEQLEANHSLSPETIDYLLRSAQAFSAEQKLKNLNDSKKTIDYPMLIEGYNDDGTGSSEQ